MTFALTFWGVRGSIACPSPRHVAFGGNTSCLHVSANRHEIILDAGTGLRSLGLDLVRRDVKSATVLMTHTHWDHMNGFPFFSPAFDEGRSFRIYAGHLWDVPGGVKAVLAGQMAQPMFPVPLETMRASMDFIDFKAGETLDLAPGLVVKTCLLRHPNRATGYRIEWEGKSLCYVTDTEHVPGQPDENILRLIEGADVVVYDCTYTDDEYPRYAGWGHSTWQEGVRLCRKANVKRLALFHHDPTHEDERMERIEADAMAEWPGTFAAREGMRVDI